MMMKPAPLIRSIAAAMSYSSGAKPLPHRKADTSSSSAPVAHLVYTGTPPDDNFHIRTLTAVLGSEEAVVYNYEDGGSNDYFSVVLTPENVVQLLKQPGVRHVFPTGVSKLHVPTGVSKIKKVGPR